MQVTSSVVLTCQVAAAEQCCRVRRSVQGIDRKRLAKLSVECYLEQVGMVVGDASCVAKGCMQWGWTGLCRDCGSNMQPMFADRWLLAVCSC